MFRDYAAMGGLQFPFQNITRMCTEQNQEYLMNWKHKFEAFVPLFLLTSEGSVLSRRLPNLAEVCVHNNAVLKPGSKWQSVGFKVVRGL
jgi:hypothetical protein